MIDQIYLTNIWGNNSSASAGLSETGSNGYKGVLHTSQNSRTRASQPDTV